MGREIQCSDVYASYHSYSKVSAVSQELSAAQQVTFTSGTAKKERLNWRLEGRFPPLLLSFTNNCEYFIIHNP
jgi:hypothetical protein